MELIINIFWEKRLNIYIFYFFIFFKQPYHKLAACLIGFTRHFNQTLITCVDNQARCPELFSGKITEIDEARPIGTN